METWEITHADGSKGKINLEEAHRIASMVGHTSGTATKEDMEEKNCEYLWKSANNIHRLVAEKFGDAENYDEDAMKKILHTYYPFSCDQADLIYEIVEWAIGKHSEKIFKA